MSEKPERRASFDVVSEPIDFILIGVLAGMTAFLDVVGVVTFPIGFGASGFYIGAAFYVAFAIWFRWRAIVALYIGLVIAALATGRFNPVTPVLALTNVLPAAIVMIAFHRLDLDPSLTDWTDVAAIVVAAPFFAVVSGVYFFGGNFLLGFIPRAAVVPGLTGWIIGDVVVILLFGIPLLKVATPVVERTSIAAVDPRTD